MNEIWEVLKYFMQNGYGINLPFININYSVLTAGKMLQITGNLIKIDSTDAGNGVFLINQSTQAETKPQFIATNSPKSLVLLLPALRAGDYKVKVVTQFSGSYLLKNPKTISYDRSLTYSIVE